MPESDWVGLLGRRGDGWKLAGGGGDGSVDGSVGGAGGADGDWGVVADWDWGRNWSAVWSEVAWWGWDLIVVSGGIGSCERDFGEDLIGIVFRSVWQFGCLLQ